ncbi:MAG: hypothetical protein H6730_11900 [Deltaproteobacteria bacterium]|nr:hypothetical protein [Deltaproteobacteria bacterium]
MASPHADAWSLDHRPGLRRALVALIFILGALPKLIYLYSHGALWGDEAALAMNIGPRGFLELGRPFVYLQVCPWGAMAGIKALTLILGTGEVGYRAFPTLAALVAIAFTYPLGARIHSREAGLVAMFLTGLGYWLTHYSAELKPYSLDATAAVILLLLAARALSAPDDKRAFIGLFLGGLVAAWSSITSLFVLAGVGTALAFDALKERRGMKRLLTVGAVGVAWVVAFGVHYQAYLVRSAVASDKKAVAFWNDGFAPFPPTSLAELRWYPGKFFYAFVGPGGLGLRYLAGLVFLYGLYLLYKKGKLTFVVLLVSPLVYVLLASMVKRYPMLGRLVLFMIPSLVVPIGVVVAEALGHAKKAVRVAALALPILLVVPTLGQTWARVKPQPGLRDMRHVMQQIAAGYRPGDVIYMAGGGYATIFDFYAEQYGLPKVYVGVDNLRHYDEDKNFPHLVEVPPLVFGKPRVWFMGSTIWSEADPKLAFRSPEDPAAFLSRFFAKHGGRKLSSFPAHDMVLELWDMSAAVTPEGKAAIENPRPE